MALFSRTPGKAIQTGTPQQQQFQNTSLNQALGILNGQGGLNPIGQQAVNRFHSQTIPSIAERFTAMGTGGSQGSSAFQGALGQAAGGLEQDLSAQQYQMMNLLSQLGHQGTVYQPEEPGFFENFLNQLFHIAPQVAGAVAAGISGSGRIPSSGQPAPNFGPKSPIQGYQFGGNPIFGNNQSVGMPQNSFLNNFVNQGY